MTPAVSLSMRSRRALSWNQSCPSGRIPGAGGVTCIGRIATLSLGHGLRIGFVSGALQETTPSAYTITHGLLEINGGMSFGFSVLSLCLEMQLRCCPMLSSAAGAVRPGMSTWSLQPGMSLSHQSGGNCKRLVHGCYSIFDLVRVAPRGGRTFSKSE
jgi:hypothetical protein